MQALVLFRSRTAQECSEHRRIFSCSGSGHTIAALVVEGQWRDRACIHFASLKIRKQVVYNIRIFVRDHLPCFMGPLASILVSVHKSGHVFRLGQKEPDGTMRFDGRACVGQVLPEDSPMEVTAVTHVYGSNTLLSLATDVDWRSDTWWVLETRRASLDWRFKNKSVQDAWTLHRTLEWESPCTEGAQGAPGSPCCSTPTFTAWSSVPCASRGYRRAFVRNFYDIGKGAFFFLPQNTHLT